MKALPKYTIGRTWKLISNDTMKEVTWDELRKAMKKIAPKSFEYKLDNFTAMYIKVRLAVWAGQGDSLPNPSGFTARQENAFKKIFTIVETTKG